jgi:hypothetical protein
MAPGVSEICCCNCTLVCISDSKMHEELGLPVRIMTCYQDGSRGKWNFLVIPLCLSPENVTQDAVVLCSWHYMLSWFAILTGIRLQTTHKITEAKFQGCTLHEVTCSWHCVEFCVRLQVLMFRTHTVLTDITDSARWDWRLFSNQICVERTAQIAGSSCLIFLAHC